MNVNDDHKRSEGCGRRQDKVPTTEPRLANELKWRFGQFLDRRQRKRDDGTAVRANGKVRERLLLQMRRQSVFDEGAELIRVWMLPGLEEFAHSESDASVGALSFLSKNEAD